MYEVGSKELVNVLIQAKGPVDNERGEQWRNQHDRGVNNHLGHVVREYSVHLVGLLPQKDRALRLEEQDSVEEVAHKSVHGHEVQPAKHYHGCCEQLLLLVEHTRRWVNLVFQIPLVVDAYIVEDRSCYQGKHDSLTDFGFRLHWISHCTDTVSNEQMF